MKFGWDQDLVDPDKGVNCQKRLSSLATSHSQYERVKLLQTVPNVDDQQWSVKLHDLCKITFSTIYEYLVERKVLLKRVSYLENVVDKRAELSDRSDKDTVLKNDENDKNVPIEYTRTLDKAYRFFKDGHV